jgi:hypothetical protein
VILRRGADAVAEDPTSKAMMAVDSLAGKTVRITYVDGVGVESVEPIGCRLTRSDCAYLLHTAILSDAYFLPGTTAVRSPTWSTRGIHLAGFLDPSLRVVPVGVATLTRSEQPSGGGMSHATFRVKCRGLPLIPCEPPDYGIGVYTPEGTLHYNLGEGFVEAADLQGKLFLRALAEDHLLSHVPLETTLSISYCCEIR